MWAYFYSLVFLCWIKIQFLDSSEESKRCSSREINSRECSKTLKLSRLTEGISMPKDKWSDTM
jgi:hypothetical protein